MDTLAGLIIGIRQEYPNFKLVPKKDSGLMKVCDFLLKLITFWRFTTFMTAFTTTVGYTVYTPEKWGAMSERVKMVILRHEKIHMKQRHKKGSFWFSISYLLLPVPCIWAYFRMKYEMEAYEESTQAKWDYFGARGFTSEARELMIKRFTGAQYFWTWPWRARIEDWYDDMVSRYVDV